VNGAWVGEGKAGTSGLTGRGGKGVDRGDWRLGVRRLILESEERSGQVTVGVKVISQGTERTR